MLTCFPTPYPGEWWYSVLCRYHVRSGNPKQQTTIRELFPGRLTAAIDAVFPNSTIRQIVTQLPEETLNIENVICQNTLFPYYTRFFSLDKKMAQMERAVLGESPVITSIRRFGDLTHWTPRYCPQCVQEDREQHGEAYWHIEHQIPIMRYCPHHGYFLVSPPAVKAGRLSYTFYALEQIAEHQTATECRTDLSLENILLDYQQLPLSAAATPGYSNLAATLGNQGYGVLQKHSKHTILDAKRLYHDLIAHYGEELVLQVYGGEKNICVLNRVGKWEMTSPERYALLQHLACVSSEVLFQQERVRDLKELELLQMRESGNPYTRKQVAEQLHITASQLDILSEKYSIKPFWRQRDPSEEKKRYVINVALSPEEREQFKQIMAESGIRYESHFARMCILSYLKEQEK